MNQIQKYVELCSEIDGVPISVLVAEHGSPLFVFSETKLRQAIRRADNAFRQRYSDVQFAWSYKTNYLQAVCRVLHQEGAIAEVVSDFEYEKARAGGLCGRDIIFNGPYKPLAILERAVRDGAKIQVDNLEELDQLTTLAVKERRSIDVAIRVFMNAGVTPVWTKFGFDADDGEAVRIIERIATDRRLRLVGLHTHIGTSILTTDAYRIAATKLIELAEVARTRCGFEIQYLNLGGGLPSQCLTRVDGGAGPTIDDYAETICSAIRRCWPENLKLPRLYLESGRALVDDAGYLIGAVVSAKRRSPGEPASGYVVDVGTNLLATAALSDYRVKIARATSDPARDCTLYGCLCMNTDVLRQAVPLPSMIAGDHLVFHPVGAYNLTQSMQFISYRPRVVLVTEGGKVEVIREKEDLNHLEALERLPDHLSSTNRTQFP